MPKGTTGMIPHIQYLPTIENKMAAEDKTVFVCYRGMSGASGTMAQIIYYNLLCSDNADLVPFCAPLCNRREDFEEASSKAMKTCRVFLPVLTSDFCESDLGADDQVRKELLMLCRELILADGQTGTRPPIFTFPVFVGDFDVPTFFTKMYKWFFRSSSNSGKEDLGSGEPGAERESILLNDVAWKEMFGEEYPAEQVEAEFSRMLREWQHTANPLHLRYNDGLPEKLRELVRETNRLYRQRPELKEEDIVWIGTRLSDIAHAGNRIKGAVTLFGENDDKNNHRAMCSKQSDCRVDHNRIDARQDEYIYGTTKEMMASQPKALFCLYNQLGYYTVKSEENGGDTLGKLLGKRAVCVNSGELLMQLSNKRCFREYCAAHGLGESLLDVVEGNYSDCVYAKVCEKLGVGANEGLKFIVQAPVASGGNGTFILTRENEATLRNALPQDQTYLFSVYREQNVSVNLHAILFQDGVVLTPGSIQLMRVDYDHIDGSSEVRRLMYRGADFLEYDRISRLEDSPENKVNGRHIRAFREQCAALCEAARADGYIGILGIDGIIYGNEVKLLEVNCRFQASSDLVNRALQDAGLPSLQEMNFAAWGNGRAADYRDMLDHLSVHYSNYSYNYIGEDEHVRHIYDRCGQCVHVCEAELDGYEPREVTKRYDNNAHLFRLVFNTNLCWVNEDGAVSLEELVCEPVREFREKIGSVAEKCQGGRVPPDCLLALKIALLIQGVNFSREALSALEQDGGVRPATNDAVDLRFGNAFCNAVINAPCNNKFQIFSPFSIDLEQNGKGICLSYYGKRLCEVSIYPLDPLAGRRINNFTYGQIAYLSTDRLRVHVTNSCIYKHRESGRDRSCKFCNIQPDCDEIDAGSIRSVVEAHWRERERSGLRHFLIGGQSPVQDEKTIDHVVRIIKDIKEVTRSDRSPMGADIYAMILPSSPEGIKRMREEGLTQLSFNIEIFDPVCAQKYMPGKGSIPRETYRDRLRYARRVFQNTWNNPLEALGQVRSMVIYGLEPAASFIKGVSQMIEDGIQPIISIFRPLRDTVLKDLVAPSMIDVYRLFFLLQSKINERFNYTDDRRPRYFMLGPDCTCCQNNTLSLPKEIRI